MRLVVKVEKVEKRKVARKAITIDGKASLDVEFDGEEVRVVKDGKVISRARGNFEEFTFNVEEYKISIRREELEEMLRELKS